MEAAGDVGATQSGNWRGCVLAVTSAKNPFRSGGGTLRPDGLRTPYASRAP